MLLLEQLLNGVQFGVFLFLLSSGLTLVFGIMGVINLAHGSFYMIGAFIAAFVFMASHSFLIALIAGIVSTAIIGYFVEKYLIYYLYKRDHLEQVLVSVALIFIANESLSLIFGNSPQFLPIPWGLDSAVEIFDGFSYPAYRLFIIVLGLVVALALFFLIDKTKIGMKIRAGESDRTTIQALGVNIDNLFAFVFVLGCALASLAGIFAGSLLSIEVDMGSDIVILSFVCIIIGGLGSIYGAFIGSMIVGISDTLGKVLLLDFFELFLNEQTASTLASALSSMVIFIVMIVILFIKPNGLFGEKS